MLGPILGYLTLVEIRLYESDYPEYDFSQAQYAHAREQANNPTYNIYLK